MKRSILLATGAMIAMISAISSAQAGKLSAQHEAAVAQMAQNPAEAEKILRQASGPTEELDYALFLHAYRPHTAKMKDDVLRLTGDVRTAIAAKGDFWGKGEIGDIVPYDGTDGSLIPLIQAASVSGAGQTISAFYAIPCGVLQKRPGLLDATRPLYGGNGDNFVPRSGCGYSRGTTPGYPEKLIAAYTDLADRADGCISCNPGTIRFELESEESLSQERMRLDPHYFLTKVGDPSQAYPYETWSYGSLSNRRLGIRIEASYRRARAALISYYRTMGLSQRDAAIASARALFSASLGGNCSYGPVRTSLRTLVLNNASIETIKTFLASKHKSFDSDPVAVCSREGGVDPMAHIAVVNPKVFQFWRPGLKAFRRKSASRRIFKWMSIKSTISERRL
jgi:hypothetical protein